jgi:hypothetical protein
MATRVASLNLCRATARIGTIEWGEAMAGITYFVALPFDVADGVVVVGEPIECLSPASAIERAQGLWKVLGHTGAVAFSRTGAAMRLCCESSATCRMT